MPAEAGFSDAARKSASTARRIKLLFGQHAYDAYKANGKLPAGYTAAGKDSKPSPKRVKPAPSGQLRPGVKILSSNSQRPGTIQSARRTNDGAPAYLVRWDKGGMGTMTPDRLIVVKQQEVHRPLTHPDSTGLQPIMDRVEKVGLRIDSPGLNEAIKDRTTRISQSQLDLNDALDWPAIADANGIDSVNFKPNSKKHVTALLAHRGAEPSRSINKAALAAILPEHITAQINVHKSLVKELQDLKQIKSRTEDDRIHPKWTEAATGRWYTGDPPIQTLAGAVREFIVPEEGNEFATIDWHQHELRFLAELTQDPNLKKIFADNVDPHLAVYERVAGKLSEDPTERKNQRDVGKMLNYALVYGLGPESLAKRLGIQDSQARQLIDNHFAQFPVMADWIRKTTEEGRRNGYVTTIAGRRIPIDAPTDPTGQDRSSRQAVNYTLQGSSADHLAEVLRRAAEDPDFTTIKATMHDALLLDTPVSRRDALALKYRALMEEPFHGVEATTETKGPAPNWKAAMEAAEFEAQTPDTTGGVEFNRNGKSPNILNASIGDSKARLVQEPAGGWRLYRESTGSTSYPASGVPLTATTEDAAKAEASDILRGSNNLLSSSPPESTLLSAKARTIGPRSDYPATTGSQQKTAAKEWSGYKAPKLRDFLRGAVDRGPGLGQARIKEHEREFNEITRGLDDAIRASGKTTADIKPITRGIVVSYADDKKLKPGRVVTDRSFQSWTDRTKTAGQFSAGESGSATIGLVMELELGTNLPTKKISGDYNEESEWVLERDLSLEVVRRYTGPDGKDRLVMRPVNPGEEA